MRPIDADELKKDLGEVLMNLMKSYETSRIEKVGFALDVVDEAETLDVAPVVHGGWKNQDYSFTRFTCTACGSINHKECTNYCPNCGANMRCGSCEHYGLDLPQCKECGKKNDFKWYKAKMDEEGQR